MNIQYLAGQILNFKIILNIQFLADQILNFQIFDVQTNLEHSIFSPPNLEFQNFRYIQNLASQILNFQVLNIQYLAAFFPFYHKMIKNVFVSTELGSYTNDAKFPWSGDI